MEFLFWTLILLFILVLLDNRIWRNLRIPKTVKKYIFIISILLIILWISTWILQFLVKLVWLNSIGYEKLLLIQVKQQIIVFAIITSLVFVIYLINIFLLKLNFFSFKSIPLGGFVFNPSIPSNVFFSKLFWLSLLYSISIGLIYAKDWFHWAQFLTHAKAKISDPIFHLDVSFYMFVLPYLSNLLKTLLINLLIIIVTLAIIYYTIFSKSSEEYLISRKNVKFASIHVSLNIVIAFIVISFLYSYNIFYLLLKERGILTGAFFTDVNIRIPATIILTIILVIYSLYFLISNIFSKNVPLKKYVITIALYFVLLFVGQFIIEMIAGTVLSLVVKPTEFSREKKYIEHSIEYTKEAYNLRNVKEIYFPANPITPQKIENNRETLENIRIWDWRALKDTLQQIQTIRFYYTFNDIDIDRYWVDGNYEVVMSSVRELDLQKLPEEAKTWVNLKLRYTHGFGVVVSSANKFSSEGLPELLVKNIPPETPFKSLEIENPRIYFGELTKDYIIVNTKLEEFDYPRGEKNVYYTYTGKDGIPLGNIFYRLLFAFYLEDGFKILFSQYITPNSKLILWRQIQERVKNIFPYLIYDDDPYIVIADGKLYWMIDAYTLSEYFPYSKYTLVGIEKSARNINYIRNPVKVVIDAYDGTVDFYVIDTNDVIINTYIKVFGETGIFKPISQMPESLQKHIRYPENLMYIQANVYKIFHTDDPSILYNQEDVWDVAKELYIDSPQYTRPYYIISKLYGEKNPEFLLILPFTPKDRDNMIAWLAVRNDGEHYGELVVYKFPKDKLVYGPMQVEARIDQHAEISSQFTLWNQMGSKVLRGNLLVIPIEDGLLYLEPVYLQAEQAKMPELKRIIVALNDKVEWAETLEKAISKALSTTPQQDFSNTQTTEILSISQFARKIKIALDNYKKYTANGQFEEAGKELKNIEMLLNQAITQEIK